MPSWMTWCKGTMEWVFNEKSSESRYHLENQHGLENAPFVDIVVHLQNYLSEPDCSFDSTSFHCRKQFQKTSTLKTQNWIIWKRMLPLKPQTNDFQVPALHFRWTKPRRKKKRKKKNSPLSGPTVLEEHACDSHLSWKVLYSPPWLKTSWPWESQNDC